MTSKCPQSTDAFQDLYRIFASRDGRVLEFEILPPAFGPILEDDCSIGITKKYLVQAFVAARRVFFDGLKSYTNSFDNRASLDTSDQKFKGDEADKRLTVASEIILLFDCEHLTACNWRKRRLGTLFNSDQKKFIHNLDIELSLMTTYLCSPLHRHTKSPTLWQHRQWIQAHLVRLQNSDYQAAQNLFRAELSIALRAGELHPRNYYAFTYMRQIHRRLSESGKGGTEVLSVQLGNSIIGSTLDWCLAHPADISGLMFLLYLLDAVPDTALRLDTVSKVAWFALDIRWEGESIWTFVDLAIRKFNLLGSLTDSSPYPWAALCDPVLLEGKSGRPWKAWLDKAHVHWAHTLQSTNKRST
ncbi:hypothetical protein BDW62DRAFT_140116 [Aspergillus aurantiobrunneus]